MLVLGLPLTVLAAGGLARRVPAPASQPAPVEKTEEAEEERPPTEPKPDPKELEEFIRGANLETDSEVEALLRRAREHVQENRYREAATVLQHVIDRPGAALSTADGRVYRPAAAMSREMLAGLPPEGREVYRLWADGEARGLVGDVDKSVDAEALGQVVRRFFLSSIGDRAALRLACLAMDRGDFSQARQLLGLIMQGYPGPTVDRDAVLARLSLASARLGDAAGSRDAWAKLSAGGQAKFAAVGRELSSGKHGPADAADWLMAFGSPLRKGVCIDLPAGMTGSDEKLWTILWEQPAAFTAPPPQPNVVVAGMSSAQARRNQVLAWREQNGATPTGQLLASGGRVFYRTPDALVCVDMATGKRLWDSKDIVAAEKNASPGMVIHSYPPYYQGQETQLYYVDRLGRALSLIDGRIYQIEENARAAVQRPGMMMGVVVNGKVQTRTQNAKPLEGNALAAIDAKTGKRIWRVGREHGEKPLAAVRFLNTPVACLGKLLVPLEDNGELVLAALSAEDGSLLWKTFLCTFISVRAQYTRPVGVWVEGTEVLVASGKGLVFSVDGVDGMVQWASRYSSQQPADTRSAMARMYQPITRGWQEDYVTAVGNAVVVVAADSESVFAFDRRTGQLLWTHDVTGPRYCLGIGAGGLLYACDEGLVRLDLASGRMSWTRPVERNGGRGVLAGDVAYMPSGSQVLRISATSGKVDEQLYMKMPVDEPVGNLLVQGNSLLVAGMDRVWAAGSAKPLFEELDRRIAARSDPADYLQRGRLHRDAGRARATVEDLRRAHELLPAGDGRKAEARTELFAALLWLSREDKSYEDLLRRADELAQTPSERTAIAMARAQALARDGREIASARQWLQVALGDGDELVEDPEQKGLRVARPMIAASALRELAGRIAPAARGELAEMVRTATATTAPSTRPVGMARAFCWAGSTKAMMEMVERFRRAHQIEVAEAVLRDLAADRDRPTAAAGLAALGEFYESQKWSVPAAAAWARLARLYGDFPEGQTARKRLDQSGPVAPVELGEPPWNVGWTIPGEMLAILRPMPSSRSPILQQQVLVQNSRDGTVRCYGLEDGRQRWHLDMPARSATTPAARVALSVAAGHGQGLLHDENIALVRRGKSLAAVSLLTGKLLWEQKDIFNYDTIRMSVSHYAMGSLGDPEMSAENGVVAIRLPSGLVRVMDLASGAVRWERGAGAGTIMAVLVKNGYVILSVQTVVSGQPTQVLICDALNGRTLGQVNFEAQWAYYARTAQWTDWGFIHTMYDQAGTCSLVGRELPSGRIRWKTDTKVAQQLPNVMDMYTDAAGNSTVVCGVYNGEVAAFDAATGAARWKATPDRPNNNLQAMGVHPSGRVVTVGRLLGQQANVQQANMQQDEPIIRCLSAATGQVELERSLGVAHRHFGIVMTPIPLNPAGRWLPIGRMEQPVAVPPGKPVTMSQRWHLMMCPLTENGAPQKLTMPGNKDTVEQLRSVAMIGKYVLLIHKDGVTAFAGTPPTKGN